MSDRRPFTITNLHRHPVHGFWMARVTNGHTIEVDRRYGSWQAAVRDRPGARSKHREFVLPDVAAALQARVRVLEKRERDGQLSVVGAGHDMRDVKRRRSASDRPLSDELAAVQEQLS